MAGNPRMLYVQVQPEHYFDELGGNDVYLNGHLIGYRPHDGSCAEEIEDEVVKTLAEMLRERLGWKTSP